eukprot:9555943-Karenia_brevis.AAC.1
MEDPSWAVVVGTERARSDEINKKGKKGIRLRKSQFQKDYDPSFAKDIVAMGNSNSQFKKPHPQSPNNAEHAQHKAQPHLMEAFS